MYTEFICPYCGEIYTSNDSEWEEFETFICHNCESEVYFSEADIKEN